MQRGYIRWVVAAAAILVTGSGFADTHYASPAGAHTAPFTEWATAATKFQDAIDAAGAGDGVLVDDGVWQLDETVVIHKTVSLRSRSGPTNCVIVGPTNCPCGATNCVAADSRRCFLASDAELAGLTITGGSMPGGESGGSDCRKLYHR